MEFLVKRFKIASQKYDIFVNMDFFLDCIIFAKKTSDKPMRAR